MSVEQFKDFWEAVQADAGLKEKLSAAKDADAVAAIAKAAGFEISVEEVAKAQVELSDEQLSGVAGGAAYVATQWVPIPKKGVSARAEESGSPEA
jgi:predicted ribosomally synthesized peptide with nif11-like leader